MPSTTFLRLSKEKQEKLLLAAKNEFAKETYANASINQIIKSAGISRGSFYMYFEDKEDLYTYILEQYMAEVYQITMQYLTVYQGDIFAVFQALFDTAITYCSQSEHRKFIQQIVENIRLYKEKREFAFFINPKQQDSIEKAINYDLLQPLAKKHIRPIIGHCIHILIWNIMQFLREQVEIPVIKGNFREQLQLLQQGIQK